MWRFLGGFLADYLRRRAMVYLFALIILLMGIVFGGLAIHALGSAQKSDLFQYLLDFFRSHGVPGSSYEAFRRSLFDNAVKTIGLMWLLGLSVIGGPLILLIIFLRGFVVGFTVGFMVDQLSFRGIALALASILPHNILIIPAVVACGGACMTFSLCVARAVTGRRNQDVLGQFLGMTVMSVLAGAIMSIASLVEGYVSPVLLELASRYLV